MARRKTSRQAGVEDTGKREGVRLEGIDFNQCGAIDRQDRPARRNAFVTDFMQIR